MTTHEFRVRWYQQAFHETLVQQRKKRLIEIAHRRWGKDEIVLNGFRELSQKRIGTYWHCFPEYAQARKAIWNGINGHTGKRRLFEAFPEQIIQRMSDTDMFLETVWGSTWQLIGSDRFDATLGSGPVGVAYSEFAISNPAAWAYHKPMIEESDGVAAFITTPRGNNHAKALYDLAMKDDHWFAELQGIDHTGALTSDQLESILEEYQAIWGLDAGLSLFEQEYHCSFAGAMVGAYYGAEVNQAERQGRVTSVPIDERYPVHTAWDLGKAANNPIWCFQVIPEYSGDKFVKNVPHIVDFYRPASDDVEEWVEWLNERGYKGTDYVPHDALHTNWGTGRTRVEMLVQLKRKPWPIPKVSVEDGRTAARQTIKVAYFDRERCELGIDGLKNYRREWDAELKRFRENPVKDWAEHIGSAFRYLGLAWRDLKLKDLPGPKPKPSTIHTVTLNDMWEMHQKQNDQYSERI